MNMNSLLIIIDERRAGGMLEAARALGGAVVAAVVGPRSLAERVCVRGFDRVLCLEPAPDTPAEAYAAQLAEAAAALSPRLILAADSPVSRMLLGAAAAKLNAAIIGAVRDVAVSGDNIVISRSMAEGKVLEDIEAAGAVAGIFDGEEVDISASQPVAVESLAAGDAGAAIRLVEIIESEGGEGLLTAARVVSVGSGLAAKNDLALIGELAAAAHAEIACTLPICDDMRWLGPNRVVGSSHCQVAPDLYIAVGISGQPQHISGIRDAKTVVAVNNDPEARIFKHCNYGIVGDLYKIVPALVSAFKNID